MDVDASGSRAATGGRLSVGGAQGLSSIALVISLSSGILLATIACPTYSWSFQINQDKEMAKSSNPVDAHRKAQKDKEKKKRKEQRTTAKTASNAKKSTGGWSLEYDTAHGCRLMCAVIQG